MNNKELIFLFERIIKTNYHVDCNCPSCWGITKQIKQELKETNKPKEKNER